MTELGIHQQDAETRLHYKPFRGYQKVYRGAGNVMFDPPQIKAWEDTRTGANSPWAPHWVTREQPEDGRWVTQVTFDEPRDVRALLPGE